MFSAIFTSTIKRRDVALLMCFSILPLLTPFLMGNQDFETMSKSDFTSSLLSFMSGALDTQYKLIIPTLIMGFIVSSVFRDEIDTGIMFLYKDIKRKDIFNLKLKSLCLVYIGYFILSLLASVLAYYGLVVPKWQLNPSLFPKDLLSVEQGILSILSTVLLNIITIYVVSLVSIKYKTLAAVLSGVFLTLLAMIAPMLSFMKYVFPNGYLDLRDENTFLVSLFSILGLSFAYLSVTYLLAKHRFENIEF